MFRPRPSVQARRERLLAHLRTYGHDGATVKQLSESCGRSVHEIGRDLYGLWERVVRLPPTGIGDRASRWRAR